MTAVETDTKQLSDKEVSKIAIKIVGILNYTLARHDISDEKKKEISSWFKGAFEQ